ncbi:Protein kinase-like [Zostera marina]|uniref:Protein kinase-like n=1 Tax=Zostera marina TaxID=29655 RepID=A0A0K9NMN4_ZOSMR|nr:Protein kinase-like [Zostera marina]
MDSAAPIWSRGKILGAGTTATVSMATDSDTGRTFAVKSSPLSESSLLQREREFHSTISSPHIISYLGYDVTYENGRSLYNIFLEYADGGSVSDKIQREGTPGLDESDVRCYTRGILKALSYMHSIGIAHCDVKGKNLLIETDGFIKIADLGCAKRVAGVGGDDKSSSSIGGTPAFMAPEVVRGENQGLEADIWAVGCTVIEMVTGKLPWSEMDGLFTTMNRIGFSDNLPKFPNSISEEGRDFLEKCLRRNPEKRWTSKELLQHPFVSETGVANISHHRSPKCVLDQDLWLSDDEYDENDIENEEEEEVDMQYLDPVDRIQILSGGICCRISNDAGDDDDEEWIAVRCWS